ncbi:uncharacterized protein STEHIDRAFT_159770 [Stereum hirsutum FP-91666 SS1]|uniref:uncharacterized protein n=1 Tax=Stereum hirsutum (strain FP-91666) TaxID=721885 RepID=UPI000444A313|nr:uncharacterized protein STEHIDRAFT_159770 [Stereum hirsutum FP-91666 SS1]EIM83170.1 hypothetical protein STEHIDRAFT_159770 [Stereum hirsutum FP-91666 SS1]
MVTSLSDQVFIADTIRLINNYGVVSSTVLWLADFLATFPIEVATIWSRKPTFHTIVFLVNRGQCVQHSRISSTGISHGLHYSIRNPIDAPSIRTWDTEEGRHIIIGNPPFSPTRIVDIYWIHPANPFANSRISPSELSQV